MGGKSKDLERFSPRLLGFEEFFLTIIPSAFEVVVVVGDGPANQPLIYMKDQKGACRFLFHLLYRVQSSVNFGLQAG